jgi:hypothetical protein
MKEIEKYGRNEKVTTVLRVFGERRDEGQSGLLSIIHSITGPSLQEREGGSMRGGVALRRGKGLGCKEGDEEARQKRRKQCDVGSRMEEQPARTTVQAYHAESTVRLRWDRRS